MVFVSGRGGSGKTAAVACIATALCRRGKTVLAIDADTGMRCLDIALGLENTVIYDAVDVIEGTCRLKQALVRDANRPGLTMLAAAQTRERSELSGDGLRRITANLKESYDYILIDAPSGIEAGFDAACSAADKAVIVMGTDPLSIRSAQRMIGILEQHDLFSPQILYNMLWPELVETGLAEEIDGVNDKLRLECLGAIPYDYDIAKSVFTGVPLLPDCYASRVFDSIALRLTGQETIMPNILPKADIGHRIRRGVRAMRGNNIPKHSLED